MKIRRTAGILIASSGSSFADLLSANLASTRLRAAVLADMLNRQGYYLYLGPELWSMGDRPVDFLYVGKVGVSADSTPIIDRWLSLIRMQKAQGAAVWVDYTDHHLGFDSPLKQFYIQALKFADGCIVPSEYMSKNLAPFFNRSIVVIPEPIEVPFLPPRKHGKIENILWFGHGSNISYLIKLLNSLRHNTNLVINILTDNASISRLSGLLNNWPGISLRLSPWSPHILTEIARISGLCIIPSDINDPRKNGASPNRLVTALALGLPTFATPLPSYQEFSNYFLEIDEFNFIGNRIEFNVMQLLEKIPQAQAQISSFKRVIVERQWLEFIWYFEKIKSQQI